MLKRFQPRQMVRAIKHGFEAQRKLYLETQLANIRHRDSQFNTVDLLRKVQDMVIRTKAALSSHDLSAVWPLMTDGMHERLNVQINFQKSEGYRDCLDHIQIVDSQICQIDSSPHFDAIHVRIAGDGIARRLSLAGDKRTLYGPRSQVFKEVWSFLRRPGAKTAPARRGLSEGACPNCGASIRLTDRMKCQSCGSIINSGEHDWVLFKVSDVCEWRARDSTHQVPGLGKVQRSDARFCPEFLEDRSAVVFWRWQEALSRGETGRLARFSSPRFIGKFSRELQGDRAYFRDVVVNSVRFVDVEISPALRRDRVYVLVKWSGTMYQFHSRGGPPTFMGPGMRTHVFALERKHGVQTDAGTGLSSAHCAGCGAPECGASGDLSGTSRSEDSAVCPYCGTPFTDAKRHWILSDVMLYYDWRSRRRKRSQPLWIPADFYHVSEIEPSVVMAWIVKVMFADKRAGPREMALVEAFGRARGFLHEKIVQLIRAERKGELDLPVPRDQKAALQCLKVLAWMAFADGNITKAEMDLLLVFASRFKIPSRKVSELVKSETSRLYKRSRDAVNYVPPYRG